jgi:hypothetical protein
MQNKLLLNSLPLPLRMEIGGHLFYQSDRVNFGDYPSG